MAELLNKLLIEQTKSRPRHSNDNGLAESKNGAVVRKHMGYTHIAAPHAAAITDFYQKYFNPYLNFHRPCGVPELVVNAKGKEKRVYRWYATPWEILRQLPDVARHLKAELTIAQLDQQAQANSDTQAAEEMQDAKRQLFASFRGTVSRAACTPPAGRQRRSPDPSEHKNQNILRRKNSAIRSARSPPVGRHRSTKNQPRKETLVAGSLRSASRLILQ